MSTTVEQDTRRFTRIAFSAPAKFHSGAGVLGEGVVSDVSYGGLCLTTRRYLKPQTLVRIPVPAGDRHLSFPAHVVWCQPDHASETFRVGLQADHRGKHTMAILSSWVLDAFRQNAAQVC
ncbi:MAG: PilZ domain-containing protein [Candidatus Hydrogenedentes bacterium]|nr:PilZ domain-containing protein [Candidatus Hydrogenedentota bacterium]